MELVIINLLGQMVKRTQMGYQTPGVNEFNMDISELPEGMYFISVFSESFISSQKLIISR